MRHRISSLLIVGLLLSTMTTSLSAEGNAPADPKKQTNSGKYLTAKEAFARWQANPQGVAIIDSRTPEEYVFVGHAPMTINIPVMKLTGKWDSEKNDLELMENPDFVGEVQKRFKPDDVLFMICRSGQRSAKCVDLLTKAGFKEVYNVIDGIEGDKVNDPENYFNGKRMKNGWKNAGAPWTYEVKPDQIVIPSK